MATHKEIKNNLGSQTTLSISDTPIHNSQMVNIVFLGIKKYKFKILTYRMYTQHIGVTTSPKAIQTRQVILYKYSLTFHIYSRSYGYMKNVRWNR